MNLPGFSGQAAVRLCRGELRPRPQIRPIQTPRRAGDLDGSACALALVMRGIAREVLLVDRTRARAKAVATDIRSGAPLSESTDIRDGDYADLAGGALAMITSGVNEKSGGATDRNDPVGRL